MLAEGVTVQWYGQAAFRLVSPQGKVIVIDPFLRNNPVTPEAHKDLKAMGRVDLIVTKAAYTAEISAGDLRFRQLFCRKHRSLAAQHQSAGIFAR